MTSKQYSNQLTNHVIALLFIFIEWPTFRISLVIIVVYSTLILWKSNFKKCQPIKNPIFVKWFTIPLSAFSPDTSYSYLMCHGIFFSFLCFSFFADFWKSAADTSLVFEVPVNVRWVFCQTNKQKNSIILDLFKYLLTNPSKKEKKESPYAWLLLSHSCYKWEHHCLIGLWFMVWNWNSLSCEESMFNYWFTEV